ncbi:hypothetical protein NEOLEDRAFT_1180504 [Neolentinus lepideus HHB14362 ss-1]|uniref:F-box domain-containing protein n=1 Tax=Neolentinus lepideus HHB14362 ss-1 TaxID=1314782 RepID=A0A165QVA3_9AGAM|nr:hypothetical protein NEOLEDRAFT_1180504 [Neolentinus lepideus HHB14362 ss-1]
MKITLEDLPSELLIKIVSLLRYHDILRTQAVSKRFEELIRTSVRLQYIIELGVAGYVHNPFEPLFTEQRLRMLVEHQAAWKRLDLRIANTISMSGLGDYRKYDRGIYLRLDANTMPGFDTLDVFDLMSPNLPSWSIHTDFEFSNDCEVDPVQDLIVLPHVSSVQQGSSLDISVLSLRLGTIHPRASCSPIRVGFESWDMPLCTSVQVADDVVALSVYTHRFAHKFEVVILEWTTGAVKMRLSQPVDRVLRDFYIVSPQWLLVTSVTRYPGRLPAVDVYSLDGMASMAEAGGTRVPTHVATYELPPPRPEHVARIRINGNNAWNYHKSSVYQSVLGCPFGTSKLSSIVHLTLRLVEVLSSDAPDGRRQHVFDIFTPLSTFLGNVETLNEGNPTEPLLVPWNVWGPQSTRWFRDLAAIHTASTHGCRVIWPDRVWDFNRIDNVRDISRRENVSPWSYIHDLPTIIKGASVFLEDIVSWLPYRETYIQSPLTLQGMWTTDRLVGWNVNIESAFYWNPVDNGTSQITEEGLDVHLLEGVTLPPLCASI